ncbi:MAG: hypothetical protein JSV51_08215 [Candidatus Bathyarchaeota archaeon]|nr:MAG: hypothetical protein JSV51_08215 [Candidatus Bathyarchaeota archaeon]
MTEKRHLRGRRYSRSDIRILEYLVELSVKHGINTAEFFNAIVFAWSNGKAICRELTVKFRVKKKDCAVFLITKDYAVLAQLPIPENILKEANPLDGFDYVSERVRNASMRKERKALDNHHIPIKDLEAGMKKINLRARVIELSKPKQVVTRFNNYAIVTNATLSDETSTIKLPLWNGQINMLSIDDQVQIENANVGVFQGKKQLRIGRNSKLKVIGSRSLKNQ